jgi:hypothetical protein
MEAGLPGEVQATLDRRDREHLTVQNHILAVQEPDVTCILPSGAFSQTIVALSVVANLSRTFSSLFRL